MPAPPPASSTVAPADYDDFDFGEEDDATTVELEGESGDGQSVRFVAAHSPYLADLLQTGAVTPNVKHRLSVTTNALVLCNDFCRVHWSRNSRSREMVDQAATVVRRASRTGRTLEETAWAAHLLKINAFFERLAEAMGDAVRAVRVPYPFPVMKDYLRYSNALRTAVGLPERQRQDIPSQEYERVSQYFTEGMTNSTQSRRDPKDVIYKPNNSDSEAEVTVDAALSKAIHIDTNPFVPPDWERDADVLTCPDCNRAFTTGVGLAISWPILRSHCRVCAKVKCRDCVKYQAERSYARPYKDGEDLNTLKCCKGCFERHSHTSRKQFLFRYIVASGLNVVEVASLQMIGGEYLELAQSVLYDVRQLFVTGEMSSSRRQLVRASRRLAGGHTVLLLRFIQIADWSSQSDGEDALAALRETREIARGQKSVACSHWHMLCNRACTEPMYDLLALHVLKALNSVPSRQTVNRVDMAYPWVDECRNVAQELFLEHVGGATKPPAAVLLGALRQPSSPSVGSPVEAVAASPLRPLRTGGNDTLKAAWVPMLLDLMHQDPTSGSVECISVILLDLCERNANLTMQVYRELVARLRYGGRHLTRYFDTLRSAIEQQGVFPAEHLHRVTSFIDMLEETRSDTNGGAEEALMQGLRRFTLIDLDRANVLPNGSFSSVTLDDDTVPVLPMPYLFDPTITITGIRVKQVRIMSSQVRPWSIPLVGVARSAATGAETQVEVKIIFKREDVRKDYVVCNAIAAFIDFCAARKLISRPITHYRVLPTSQQSGIIQVVLNSVTVEDCVTRGKQSQPMYTWLKDNMSDYAKPVAAKPVAAAAVVVNESGDGEVPERDPAKVQQKKEDALRKHHEDFKATFLDSSRFYIFVTYLLGIRDRHRGNVLLCADTGSICHIDFGFVLGDDTFFESMTSQYVRYDDDLRIVIESYYRPNTSRVDPTTAGRRAAFLNDTAEIVIAIRPHLGFVRMLLDHWVVHGITTGEKLDKLLVSRCFMTHNDRDAKSTVVKRIEGSFGNAWLSDAAHDVGQIVRGEGVAAAVGRSLTGVASYFSWR